MGKHADSGAKYSHTRGRFFAISCVALLAVVASGGIVMAHFMQQNVEYHRRIVPEQQPSPAVPMHEAPPPAPVTTGRIGLYLSATSAADDGFRDGIFDALAHVDSRAVVVDVKGSFVYFPVERPLGDGVDVVRPVLDLERFVDEAHARDIAVIARFIAAKDSVMAQSFPETQIRHPVTGKSAGNTWVDLLHPAVLDYNRAVLEAVVRAGVDEVNFDYIRYPTEYAPSAIGLSGEEKAQHIEPFLLMARDVVDSIDPNVRLGISTYAILGWNFPVNFEPLGQDIARFGDIVDVVSPMAYPATFAEGAYYNPAINPGSRMYHLVYRTMEGYKELLGENSHKLRPWIQGYSATSQNISDEIDAVFDAGICGFTVWNARNDYAAALGAMRSMAVPDHCVGNAGQRVE